jgi:3-methylcrotonyl-CoA carboxylase alpha subunit
MSVLADEGFRRAAVATDFLNVRRTHIKFGDGEATGMDLVLAAVWCAARRADTNDLWADTRGWRPASPSNTVWRFGSRSVAVELAAPERYVARTDGKEMAVHVVSRDAQSLSAECDGGLQKLHLFEAAPVLHLFRNGLHAALHMAGTDDALQVTGGAEEGSLLTPLPGTIVALHVAAGARVARGAPLVTVEAMKMEHTLTAPYDGVVSRVAFGLADRVQAGAILVELAPV